MTDSAAPYAQPMMPAGTFNSRTILITGGGTGLGQSMGRYFLTLGANLVICGRRQDVVQKTADELQKETGGKVLALGCDVRQPEQVETMLAAAYEKIGRAHV